MHRNVEIVKKNLSEDTDYMTAEMSALIAKVDNAILKAKGTSNDDLNGLGEVQNVQEGEELSPEESKA